MDAFERPAFQVTNANGTSPFVLVCDHASNFIPPIYGDMGLTLEQRLSHIAWDPGALAVSLALSQMLDAPIVASTVSRLIIDCNRDTASPGLIWTLSEATQIAVNVGLSETERAHRIEAFHAPFHGAITTLLDQRLALGIETILVCMHSFTPVYLGVARPWQIGLIHGHDTAYTQAVFDAIRLDDPSLTLGWNEPYAALNGVTLTLERHGDQRGLQATMIEIRNTEILEPDGVALWAGRLARSLEQARQTLGGKPAGRKQEVQSPMGQKEGHRYGVGTP